MRDDGGGTGDERNGVVGGRHVPCDVHHRISRCERRRLPDNAASGSPSHRSPHLIRAHHDAEPGDRLELVEGAARVAQSSPGHHRNLQRQRIALSFAETEVANFSLRPIRKTQSKAKLWSS